jgi:V/A-type H+/Na+-transporting ATPase subunit I
MFTPLAMKYVELSLLEDDAAQAALLLANYGAFDPEIVEGAGADQLPELPGEAYRQAYTESRAHLDKILVHCEISPPDVVNAPMQPVSLPQLTETGSWLATLWGKCSDDQERARGLRDEIRHAAQLLAALDQFKNLSIDLTLLQKKSALLDVRVGSLPYSSIERFEEALGLAGYVAIPFFTSEDQVRMIIAGTTGQAQEMEHVLQAAGWRAMDIPPEFHGSPDDVRQELSDRLARMTEEEEQENLRRRAEGAEQKLRERLVDAADSLARAAPYAELAGLIRARGALVRVCGWIPSRQLSLLKTMLEAKFGARFVLRARDPRDDERRRVPSVIRHPRWLQPFASLVLDYGVPRYGEIDPTLLFALTFVLMFGMMFGDVGQGVIVILAGVLLRRRLGQYATLAVAVGLSSTAFGLLFGSVFGFEHVIPALWMSPLSDPMRMLGVALAWGIGFILLATMLTIRNRIVDGRMLDALLDSHGAAGLLLYAGLLIAAWRYAATGRAAIVPLLAICVALAAIFAHSWRESQAVAGGEKLLIAVMDAYESIMAYVSNTLSFLRLAAFSLNHVALFIAFFTVAKMLHAPGYWATVVAGNLFILVLEGGIVAIQTLRLEYYEGFSRFFSGDGRAFRPLTLRKRQALAIQGY